jgi:LPS export ABC transporter protein LptC
MTLSRRLFQAFTVILLGGSLILSSCKDGLEQMSQMQVYDGPVMEGTDIETLYSDSARVRVKVLAKKQLQFESGDRTFPEGIYIEFFNEQGQQSSSLKANHAKYDKATDIYIATGDVIVKDLTDNKQLNSEELHWNKREKRVYTEKFVRIQTAEETLMGEGLTATQDFSSYKILKPTGVFSVKQE